MLVPKTLKATIVLRMTEIDQVIIRGIHESSLLEKEVGTLLAKKNKSVKIIGFTTPLSFFFFQKQR